MRLGTPVPPGAAPHEESIASALASPAPIWHWGDYELLEEIARGGMGIVYRARQKSLNRMVAVKVLLGGQFANEGFTRRFRREAEAAASLNHPNIVSIYDVGEHEGQPYFSMELIEGRSLAELVRDKPLPARQAAQLLQIMAGAMHFAHERHLLHRDLKPSNVLVDALNMPHITDFGLAKQMGGDANLTLTGQVLGTPNYMPPEQADPKRGPPTAASDVYSLGAILYELLTSRAPFMAGTLTQTLRLVSEAEPVSPRLLNPSVPRDLETICTKCLEKDAKGRYASAQELADELGRFLRDEPIRARPIGALSRLMRWCRRKPALALSMGVGAALLLIVAIGSPIAIIHITAARNHAEAARQEEAALRARAQAAERETHQQLHVALLEQARATVRSGELGQRVHTLDAARRAAAISNTVELRCEAFAALALPDLRFEGELSLTADVSLAVLDPKFERLAVGHGTNAVEIRSVPDQRLLATFPASVSERATFGKWSPDGRFFAIRRGRMLSASREPTHVEVWDVASGRQVLSLPRTPCSAFSFHPNLPRILGGDLGDSVSVWDLESGRATAHFAVTGIVHHLEFSPDGQSFLAQHRIAGPWFTSMFDTTTGEGRSRESNGWIDGMAWHPTGRWAALAARTGDVYLYDPKNGETDLLGRHKHEARTATFSPDGNYLFTGGEEQEIISWDLRLRQRAFTILLRSAQLQFDTEGLRGAVIDRTRVLIYSLERSVPCRELIGDLGGSLRQGAVSPDGRWLAVGGAQRLGLWDLSREGPAAVITEPKNATPFFSPDSSQLFAFWGDGFARWRITAGPDPAATPRLTALPIYKPGRISSAGFAAGSLVLGTLEGAIIVPGADLATGPGERFDFGYANGKISPNGSWGAFRKDNPPFEMVYRLKPWDGLKFIEADAEVFAEAFTPGSDELAVATETSVTFLDTHRWERQRRFPVLLGRHTELIFAADGEAFWLVHDAGSAALHDTRTFETLLPLPVGTIPLAVSPDGVHLAVSVDAWRVQLWNMVEVRKQLRELGLDWGREGSEVSTLKR